MAKFTFDVQTGSFQYLTNDQEIGIDQSELQSKDWWYGFNLKDRFKQDGAYDPAFRLTQYLIDRVNFNQKSVLNIGTRDGFFLFLSEVLSASKVYGIDDTIPNMNLRASFDYLKSILQSDSEVLPKNIENLSASEIPQCDIVTIFDVITRHSDPKKILDLACKVCKEDLLICSHFLPSTDDFPICAYYRSYSGEKEYRDQFAPNPSWFQQVLEMNGFQVHSKLQWPDRSNLSILAKRVFNPETIQKQSIDQLPIDSGTESDTAFLVISCERYSQAWDPFFTLLFRYWPECPYKIYLCSDTGRYEHARVENIEIGRDLGWAKNFRYALEQIPASRIILTLEDFLPSAPWDNLKIRKLVRHAHEYDAACLRFFPIPGPTSGWYACDALGTIGASDPYRISTMNAIWKKQILLDIVKEDMSAWQFELEGSRMAALRTEPFLSWRRDAAAIMPYFCTAITKGVWEPQAIELLKREKIATDHIRIKV